MRRSLRRLALLTAELYLAHQQFNKVIISDERLKEIRKEMDKYYEEHPGEKRLVVGGEE